LEFFDRILTGVTIFLAVWAALAYHRRFREQWEYKEVFGRRGVEEGLNRLGMECWELVSATPTKAEFYRDELMAAEEKEEEIVGPSLEGDDLFEPEGQVWNLNFDTLFLFKRPMR
jgi:hypothetical protein